MNLTQRTAQQLINAVSQYCLAESDAEKEMLVGIIESIKKALSNQQISDENIKKIISEGKTQANLLKLYV